MFVVAQLRNDLAQSEEEGRALKSKLQSALKEGVELLESVQRLESEKAVLEERLLAMHDGLSQTVI